MSVSTPPNLDPGTPRMSAPHLEATPPDFKLRDLDGREVHLADLYVMGPLVVVFCRCSDKCAEHLREFKKRNAALLEASATLVVVVEGEVAKVAHLAEKERLPYRVLADESGRVLETWGLKLTAGKDVAATFVIDKSGTIRFRALENERAPAARVLEWLRGHGGGGEAQG